MVGWMNSKLVLLAICYYWNCPTTCKTTILKTISKPPPKPLPFTLQNWDPKPTKMAPKSPNKPDSVNKSILDPKFWVLGKLRPLFHNFLTGDFQQECRRDHPRQMLGLMWHYYALVELLKSNYQAQHFEFLEYIKRVMRPPFLPASSFNTESRF